MTEPDAPTPSQPGPPGPPERVRVEGPPSARRLDALPLLYVVGFLVLAGSLFYLYRHPSVAPGTVQEAARVNTLEDKIGSLADRLGVLEQGPAPIVPNIAPLVARIAALEAKPAAAPTELGPLEARLKAVEVRPPVDLAPLGARIDGAVAKAGTDAKVVMAQIDALDIRVAMLEKQAAAMEKQATAIEKQAAAVSERAGRAARVQAAAAALATGQMLGDIPGAPAAVTRFATEAPPTEAALRQSFEHYAAAATEASQPAVTADKSFGERLWARAQQSVMVRQGGRVLLGDPIAGVLAEARTALDTGNLPGALGALNGLAGPAAAAMKPWTDQVRSLLDARAALAAMAAR